MLRPQEFPPAIFFKAYGCAIDLAKPFHVDLVDLQACRPAIGEKIETEGMEL